MRSAVDIAREVYGAHAEWNEAQLERLNALVAIVRADERDRLKLAVIAEKPSAKEIKEKFELWLQSDDRKNDAPPKDYDSTYLGTKQLVRDCMRYAWMGAHGLKDD
jgi:hypothetical protein